MLQLLHVLHVSFLLICSNTFLFKLLICLARYLKPLPILSILAVLCCCSKLCKLDQTREAFSGWICAIQFMKLLAEHLTFHTGLSTNLFYLIPVCYQAFCVCPPLLLQKPDSLNFATYLICVCRYLGFINLLVSYRVFCYNPKCNKILFLLCTPGW